MFIYFQKLKAIGEGNKIDVFQEKTNLWLGSLVFGGMWKINDISANSAIGGSEIKNTLIDALEIAGKKLPTGVV